MHRLATTLGLGTPLPVFRIWFRIPAQTAVHVYILLLLWFELLRSAEAGRVAVTM